MAENTSIFHHFSVHYDRFMRITYLFLAALLLASCSRKSEEQLYSEARNYENQNLLQLAIDDYHEIVQRFPKGTHAEEAQYRIALIYNNDLKDMQKAVDAYRAFAALFPQSKETPSAMFLTGFLYNNELHRLDSAKMAYESFLQKYPNDELAQSAKYELQTLGQDPTVVLHKGADSSQAAGAQ